MKIQRGGGCLFRFRKKHIRQGKHPEEPPDKDIQTIFRALKVGACGYVLKRADEKEIPAAIAEVRAGGAQAAFAMLPVAGQFVERDGIGRIKEAEIVVGVHEVHEHLVAGRRETQDLFEEVFVLGFASGGQRHAGEKRRGPVPDLVETLFESEVIAVRRPRR